MAQLHAILALPIAGGYCTEGQNAFLYPLLQASGETLSSALDAADAKPSCSNRVLF